MDSSYPVSFSGDATVTDDAAARRMGRLFDLGRPQDFVGIYLVLRDGGYTRDRLVELLRARDPGYDPVFFAGALAELPHIPDDQFTPYGLDDIQIAMMRARFADWYRALVRAGLRS
ncbi:MAG: hypothetical protein JWO67_230 [Streptosporangiaceae bacterium]|jgi:hypothetical protein|nr:hypothetical protein [Streptosporangiaceae bacterium]